MRAMVRKWFSYFPFLLIVPAVFLLLGGKIEFKESDENWSGDGEDLIFTLAEVAALTILLKIFLCKFYYCPLCLFF